MSDYIHPADRATKEGRALQTASTYAEVLAQLQSGEALVAWRSAVGGQAVVVARELDFTDAKRAGWKFYAVKQELADTAR